MMNNNNMDTEVINPIDVTLYQAILEQARDIVLVIDMAGKILYANQTAVKVYGYSADQLRQLRIYDLRAPETRDAITAQMNIAQQRGTLFRTVHVCRNGETFPVEVSSQRIRFLDKEAVVSIIRDISATVEMEVILQKNEENIRILHDEAIRANEELIAAEEELRQQFDELMVREEAIRRQNLILASLHDTALGLMGRLELNDVLHAIVASAIQLLSTPHGFIALIDEEEGIFDRKVAAGKFIQETAKRSPVTKGLQGKVYATGQIAVVHDYSTWEHRLKAPFFDEMHCFVMVPLKTGEKISGAFGLAFSEPGRTLVKHEISLLERFADLASLALDNATLVRTYKTELTDRIRAEEALKVSERELRKSQTNTQALINAIPDMLFIIKCDGTFTDIKMNKEQLYMPPDQFLGKKITEVFPGEIAVKTMQSIERTLETGDVQVFEYQLPMQGSVQYYEARIVACSDEEVLAICRNITERKLMEEQLKHLSLHDALTEVYNRAFFEDQMKHLQRVSDGSAGVFVCDVDGLKIINDTLGHNIGDVVLKAVAGILKKSFRSGDFVARIGGDEFAVLLPSNSVKLFEAACRRIRERIARYNVENPMVPISLSMGFAVSQDIPVDMDALFKKADNNMYREKLHQQKSTRSAIVQALIRALEARDFITEGHGDRLQGLVEALARALGLAENSIADLRLLAHFHDIGKVGIPDHILFKPGRLTEEEWAIMRQHCEIGKRIAMSAPDLAPIADWILKHHEWWNGKGYPLGLAGNSIPLECRILALADAYDAMINDRPYRKALSQKEAWNELRKCAGKQFDPALVTIFMEMLKTANEHS
jgi:diguanylate cyclase (GGDEF)-like protein/PAS domain S-box-containing protein